MSSQSRLRQFFESHRGNAGASMLAVLGLLVFVSLVGGTLISKAGRLGRYTGQYAKVRQGVGVFQYVHSMADCSRISACTPYLALLPPVSDTPVVALPSSTLTFDDETFTVRAKCAVNAAGKFQISLQNQVNSTWKDLGVFTCK